jgi:hypothetical protein
MPRDLSHRKKPSARCPHSQIPECHFFFVANFLLHVLGLNLVNGIIVNSMNIVNSKKLIL